MSFKDLDELVEPWLDLPIRGKKYRVHSVDAETGIWCQRALALGSRAMQGEKLTDEETAQVQLDDDQERDFNRRILGDAYDDMIADKLPWEFVKLASRTVFLWTVDGRESAEAFWARGGRPEDKRPAPQDRKPAKKKSSPSSSKRRPTPA